MMKVDLVGRISNIPLGIHRPLLPLFEAVVNSIHSIQERGINNGEIEIIVKRDQSQILLESLLPESITDSRAITEFEIIDNGAGFDDENFESFTTSDTKHKQGAKGIGRFMWLKAFEAVRISSVYPANGGFKKRTFNFRLSSKGVENLEVINWHNEEPKTKVSLMAYKERYQKTCPKSLEIIGERLIEHCLIYFLSSNCPHIKLRDDHTSIYLNEHFNNNVKGKTNTVSFTVKNEDFKLTHLRLYFSNEKNHEVHICGNDRVVESWNLGKRIPDLNAKLNDEEGNHFKYASCVVAEYLDKHVNVERTGFNIPKQEELQGLFIETVSMDEIETAVLVEVRKYLEDYLRPVKEEKTNRIAHFIETKAPQYRATVKYMPDALDQIPPDLPEEKLDIELHRLKARFNIELKEQTQHLIDSTTGVIEDADEYLAEYNKLLSKISDLSTDQLAEYVLYRKSIISILDKSLQIRNSNKYLLEAALHRIIYPMRKSSDEVDYEQHNLWLIDEKLSYHYFLSSDQRLDKLDVIDSDSDDRPDIVVFNKALAYAESAPPFNSIVIIEFKRPMRDDYDVEDNPFEQVNRYINRIRDSKINDVNGRPVRVSVSTPFYVYIICDMTERIEYLAVQEYDFTKTPDGWGYFNFKKNMNAYIEVISYTKLVEDAKKRNRVLFDKLNLPGI